MGAGPRDQVRGGVGQLIGELAQLTVTGLLVASLLALGAVGLSLTFGVARFANVAHPDFMMLGAYATFAFNSLVGVPFWWAALLGIAAAVLVGVPVARLAYDHLMVLALAALAAKGDTAGDALKANIRKVSNPPGKVVGSWADAAGPVAAGEKVNYEGASSAVDFDENGDVKTDFGVYRIKSGKWALDRVIKYAEVSAS